MILQQSKYEKLADYLKEQDADKVTLTFEEVEEILEEPLPGAAEKRAWWANSATNNHALNGWMDVGWESANVNMEGRVLDFIKKDQSILEPVFLRSERQVSRRSRYPGSKSSSAELDRIAQQAGGVDVLRQYMVVVERYLFGEITEMELGQELRRLFHRRR